MVSFLGTHQSNKASVFDLTAAKEKLEIVLSASVQGEAGGRGGVQMIAKIAKALDVPMEDLVK